jgi:hypothetical protein
MMLTQAEVGRSPDRCGFTAELDAVEGLVNQVLAAQQKAAANPGGRLSV